MLIEHMAAEMRLTPSYIRSVVQTASHRYKVYAIRKKSGGTREICHPARELKLLQHWLIQNIFSRLPLHSSATAYRIGKNIRDNALLHGGQNYLLRIDFTSFFPSIKGRDINLLLRKNAAVFDPPLSREDADVLCKLVCRNDSLTIGAPTSPLVSNCIIFDFDSKWYQRCAEVGVVYSRYADDIYCSSNTANVLAPLLERIRADVAKLTTPRLTINNAKTAFTSRKRRRLVTGLVLTPERRVSLGRQRKRYIRSLVFRYKTEKLGGSERAYLRGFISYAQSVDAAFVANLTRKYGRPIIDAIRRVSPPKGDKPTA